jgi:hypothetical protein
MKKNYIILIMFFVLGGLLAVQSCTKDNSPTPVVNKAAVPSNPTPAIDGIVAFTGSGQNVTLTWDGSGDNSDNKWDVFVGRTAKLTKVASGVSGNTYSFSITQGGTFYWQVVTVDKNNVKSTSSVWNFDVNSSPILPTKLVTVPATGATGVSCTPTISWTPFVDAEDDELTYNLYLGTQSSPNLFTTGISDTTTTVTATLTPNTLYYCKVVANDPFGGTVESPVWSFTTGALPIATFTGAYNVDEPAETYSYDVTFTSPTTTTIKTTNYWNSGWIATFTLDLSKLTYSMTSYTFSSGWAGVESGIIDKTTGMMTGTYTLWKDGVVQEQGIHTYTKK